MVPVYAYTMSICVAVVGPLPKENTPPVVIIS